MPVIRLKSLKAWGSGLAAIAKLNGALCRALPASAAAATLNGSNANAEKLKAHVPNHCLTEPDFALDFIAHDLCRTTTDANDSQFQSLHEWRRGLPHQNFEIIFLPWEMWCLICRHREQARLPQG
jgi:hypothetical protein